VFLVDRRSNKNMIKAAAKKVYGLDVQSVNTMISPLGQKKAFVRLAAKDKAIEAASRIGLL
jgi:ribosomal protein L23